MAHKITRLGSLVLSLWFLGMPDTAWTQVMNQDQCLLSYMPSGRSKVAVGLVQGACNYLSLSISTWAGRENERSYNECLLLNLGNIDNDQAALLISRACHDRYRSRFQLNSPRLYR
jgi:hypothetical protein